MKIIISKPMAKDCQYKKIVVEKKGDGYQAAKYTEKQVFHDNFGAEDLQGYLMEVIHDTFLQVNAWDEKKEYSLLISKKGAVTLRAKASKEAPDTVTEHNRKKNYILDEGQVIPPLVDMGIFTGEGKVVKSMYDKFRQINRFIEMIDDAISEGKKVAFLYNTYGIDKQLHPRKDTKYIVNPYQMVANEGKYYLICNYDKYDTLSNYRIDRITGIKMLDENRKPVRELKEREINLPKHMAEHLYMFAGESIHAKFKAQNHIIDQIIDWFGFSPRMTKLNEDECIVEVDVNKEAFFWWSMQYGLHIEVLEPLDIRERVKNASKCMWEKYKGDNENGKD